MDEKEKINEYNNINLDDVPSDIILSYVDWDPLSSDDPNHLKISEKIKLLYGLLEKYFVSFKSWYY